MKKTLVAMASVAALGAMSTAAMAQSSMTIYGNLDQTLVQTSQGGKSATSTASNNNSSSYWGITSTEDMGGGLKASFDLRSEITLMTGQAASTTTSATNAGQTSTAAITQNTITNAGDKPSFFNRYAFL
jgi:predicted porin